MTGLRAQAIASVFRASTSSAGHDEELFMPTEADPQ